MDGLIEMFKALSDKTRLRIIWALLEAKKELCICELMDVLQIPQYNISRHMKELRLAGLVTERRAGKFVFYSLVRPEGKVHGFLLQAMEAVDRKEREEDGKRLHKRLEKRVSGKCVVGTRGCGC